MTLLLSPLWKVLFGKLSLVTYSVFLLYLFVPGVVINYRLFADTLLGSYDLDYKFSLTLSLLGGSLIRFTSLELMLVTLTGFLLGINVSLLILSVQTLNKTKHLSLSVGGVGLVALVSTGCASCGISILSVLGISSAFLPFHGPYIYMFSLFFLSLSAVVAVVTYRNACEVKQK